MDARLREKKIGTLLHHVNLGSGAARPLTTCRKLVSRSQFLQLRHFIASVLKNFFACGGPRWLGFLSMFLARCALLRRVHSWSIVAIMLQRCARGRSAPPAAAPARGSTVQVVVQLDPERAAAAWAPACGPRQRRGRPRGAWRCLSGGRRADVWPASS